jgi:hypothetical protein
MTVRVQSSIQSLSHQRRDLHQLTYLYLSEDREPTSHQVVSDFRLSMRYYHVTLVSLTIFHIEIHQKSQKFTIYVVL